MFKNHTLNNYIARRFLASFSIVLWVVSAIIFIVDSMELLRRSYGKDLALYDILCIVAMRLPNTIQEIITFIILISSMLCYGKLARSNELIIMRSAGISAIQFILPAGVTAAILSFIYVLMLTPVVSYMFVKSEQIEDRILRGKITSASALLSGIWLRDYVPGYGNIIINAKNVNFSESKLRDVAIVILDKNFSFQKRIDADEAFLESSFWKIYNSRISTVNFLGKETKEISIPTTLNIAKLHESFNKPGNISFWQLPNFITNIKKAGLAASRHSLYFWSLCVMPLLLAGMTFLGAGFVIRINNRMQNNLEIFLGVIISFIVYFSNQIVSTMGIASTIPIYLAVTFPILIAFSVSFLMIMRREDS